MTVRTGGKQTEKRNKEIKTEEGKEKGQRKREATGVDAEIGLVYEEWNKEWNKEKVETLN